MNKKKSKMIIYLFTGLFLVVSATGVLALEPINNNNTYDDIQYGHYGNNTVLSYWKPGTPGWSGYAAIHPAGDIDYYVVTCGNKEGGHGVVKDFGIYFDHQLGDLDMQAFTVDGDYLGGSYSTGNSEKVDTGSHWKSALVVQIYGYWDATEEYDFYFTCI